LIIENFLVLHGISIYRQSELILNKGLCQSKGLNMAKATFGAGCFWHPQHVFDQLKGISMTFVGYMGGTKSDPSYEEVCSGSTGHVEVVQLEYDPDKISYESLLDVLWKIHDPTQLNRQGPDYGTQYRSVIFFHDSEQEQIARSSIKGLVDAKKFKNDIVTAIEPAAKFWMGEDYHQKYFARMNRS
jgi:peptide-methionine (S)-S-oxide reductase